MKNTMPLLAFTLAAACATDGELKDGAYHDNKVSYRLGLPGDGWDRLKLDTANVAWFNPALSASLMANSHCDGVKDAPLTGLTEDLLIGITDRAVVSQQPRPWARREALETIATGKLDGVDRKLALFVLKKDGCVYDFMYIGDHENGSAVAAFDDFVNGFAALS